MDAGEGDSDWGGDDAADTTTTEELLPAGRSSNLDHSGQQHVRLQEEELHHFLLNKEEAAAAAETHVSLKESEAAAGAPGASPDEPTISVSKFPLPVNLHLNLSFAKAIQPFGFGLLPCKGVQEPCLNGRLGGTPTWGTTNGAQTFRNVANKLGCLLVLCCAFPLSNHKHTESIHMSQKLFG
jgi:hypothetical protein